MDIPHRIAATVLALACIGGGTTAAGAGQDARCLTQAAEEAGQALDAALSRLRAEQAEQLQQSARRHLARLRSETLTARASGGAVPASLAVQAQP